MSGMVLLSCLAKLLRQGSYFNARDEPKGIHQRLGTRLLRAAALPAGEATRWQLECSWEAWRLDSGAKE